MTTTAPEPPPVPALLHVACQAPAPSILPRPTPFWKKGKR